MRLCCRTIAKLWCIKLCAIFFRTTLYIIKVGLSLEENLPLVKASRQHFSRQMTKGVATLASMLRESMPWPKTKGHISSL